MIVYFKRIVIGNKFGLKFIEEGSGNFPGNIGAILETPFKRYFFKSSTSFYFFMYAVNGSFPPSDYFQ